MSSPPPGVPSDGPSDAPSDATVHAIHDRYLEEIVEGMNLCPFSRKSREAGRVERPIFRPSTAEDAARHAGDLLERTIARNPAVEILLLTVPVPGAHPWSDAATFEGFLTELRADYEARAHLPSFYMVSFHPRPRHLKDQITRPHELVPAIRRTPDPVIQCVRAEVLDQVRREAQLVHDARLRAEVARQSPELLALLEGCVTTDPEISSDIAQANFEAVGQGEGRARLDACIADIHADRDRRYGPKGV